MNIKDDGSRQFVNLQTDLAYDGHGQQMLGRARQLGDASTLAEYVIIHKREAN